MATLFLVLGWVLFAFLLSFLLYQWTYFWLYPSKKEKEQEIGQIVAPVLAEHFNRIAAGDLLILSREFSKRVHVEFDRELHSLLREKQIIRSYGLELEYFVSFR